MERIDKCKLAVEKGIKYDPNTGKIYGIRGKEITRKHTKGYIEINMDFNGKGFTLLGHHFAWYWVYGNVDFKLLDHDNRIKTDNRITNLRIVTDGENRENTDAKGFTFNKINGKYLPQIMSKGKRIYLGYCDTPEEARQSYLNAKQIYHIKNNS